MRQPLSTSDIKRVNRRLVLDAIFRSGTTSRTQLAKDLSLSKPSISDNLESLLAAGIVKEIGESSSGPSGGRKQILLQFNPMNRYVISIDLSSNSVIFALSDLVGDIFNTFEIAIAVDTTPESCMELLKSGTQVLLQSLGTHTDDVYCIAIAAPGSYDEDGVLLSCNPKCGCPPWHQINLVQSMHEAFEVPVFVCNNIKAATLGEWVKSTNSQQSNMLYLSIGLGIGAGIVLNGKIFYGENYDAGEVYDYIDTVDHVSGDTFENTTCSEYLKDQCCKIGNPLFRDKDTVTMNQIVQAYQDGDAGVCGIVDGICRRLAVMAYNQMNFISIRLIYFAGEYAPFGSCFAKHLNQLFAASSRPMPTIKITELGKYASIQGMVCLARQRYFEQICSQ